MRFLIKCGVVVFLCIMLYMVAFEFTMPTRLSNGETVFLDGLAELPDADLRAQAEELAKEGDYISAVTLLEYIIENDMGDKAAAELLLEEYIGEIAFQDSALGKLYSGGKGFVTGEVTDFSSLAGSTTGDLVLWGDIRDLGKELVFEDEADPVIVILSAGGLLTTAVPIGGDQAASLLKAVKKVGALSEPLLNVLKKSLHGFGALSREAQIAKLKDIVMPIYTLLIHSKSWNQFTAMLRSCDNLDQIKQLTKIASSLPKNAQSLSQVLTATYKLSPETKTQAINFITNYGPKGLDSLHAAMRKGGKGIEFLLKSPFANTSLTRKTVLGGFKFTKFVFKGAPVAWDSFVRSNYFLASLLKSALILVLALLILFLLGAKPLLTTMCQSFQGKPKHGEQKAGAAKGIGFIFMAFVAVSLLWPLANYFGGFSADGAIAKNYGTFVAGGAESGSSMSVATLSIMGGYLLLLLFIYYSLYKKAEWAMSEILGFETSAKQKMARIENADIYFDLPLYIGLGATILAFIVITLGGVNEARTMAYSATFLGILFAVVMRLNILRPTKEKILSAAETSSPQLLPNTEGATTLALHASGQQEA